MTRFRILILSVAIIAAGVFGLFVWPTPYVYYFAQVDAPLVALPGEKKWIIVRLHRVTGRVEFHYAGKDWAERTTQ